jgi:hypothetical protein
MPAGAQPGPETPRDGPTIITAEKKPPVKRPWKQMTMDLPPTHEFLVFITTPGLERLSLPDAFTKAFARYHPGYALLREESPKQKTWKVSTVWEHGGLHLAGDWGRFAVA